MSFRLVDRFLVARNIPNKYKPTLIAFASYADNDGTNIYATKESMAVKAAMSRWTMYDRIQALVELTVIKEAKSHKCKSPKCKGGTLHFTKAHGHYTQCYFIDLDAVARLKSTTVAKRSTVASDLKPTVASSHKDTVASDPKPTVANADATLPLVETLPSEDTPASFTLATSRKSDSPTTPAAGLNPTISDGMTEAEQDEYESMITLVSMWWSLHPELYTSSPSEDQEEEPAEDLDENDPFAEPSDNTLNVWLEGEKKLEPRLLHDEATMLELLRTHGFESLHEFLTWLPKSNNWFGRLQSLTQLQSKQNWEYISSDIEKYYSRAEEQGDLKGCEEFVQEFYLAAGGMNADAIAMDRLNPILWSRADALEEWAADVYDDLYNVEVRNPFWEQDEEEESTSVPSTGAQPLRQAPSHSCGPCRLGTVR